jgi:Sortase domain
MNNRWRRPRSLGYFAMASVAFVLLGAGAIAATSGRGGVSSAFAGHRQGAPDERKGYPVAEPLARGPLREKPFATKHSAARPLVADIENSRALLEIPAIGVRASLVPTGAEGAPGMAALTVPDNIHTVAWWDGTVLDGDRVVHEDAPSPGQPGVAVIAGHIDSASAGPGALYDLRELAKGDAVEIVDSLGRISTWTVSGPPETAPKTDLPSALWVSNGPPRLAIVTCGGAFDSTTGHYLDNVIVWATPRRPLAIKTTRQ